MILVPIVRRFPFYFSKKKQEPQEIGIRVLDTLKNTSYYYLTEVGLTSFHHASDRDPGFGDSSKFIDYRCRITKG